jgi:hypothetical protein
MELERQDRQQKLKIDHLTETAQGQHSQILSLQKAVRGRGRPQHAMPQLVSFFWRVLDVWCVQVNQIRDEKEEVARELEELRIKLRQSEAGAQVRGVMRA